MPNAYPLDWPSEKPRTPIGERRTSAFKRLEWDKCLRDLQYEVDMIGGKTLVLSTGLPLRLDGRPRGDAPAIDPGVAIYFDLEGMPVRLACDLWRTTKENIRAVVLHLEAMRGQERWGVGTRKQAFSGYSGLAKVAIEDWRLVLGLPRHGTVTRADVERAYRQQMTDAHPDHGGNDIAAARINAARDRALDGFR